MSTTGMAIFVFVGFLLPVPLLHWLDRPRLFQGGDGAPRDHAD